MERGIWKGQVSFGLLNIPVILKGASQEKEIHFSMLDARDHAPVGYVHINKETGEEVAWKQIVKGYKYDKDKFVIMTDEDFKRANVKASHTLDIQDFVELSDLDPMLFEKPYYLVPQKGGEKSYALLRQTLERTEKVAIATFVMRSKQHLAAILSRGDYLILEILRFSHEIIEVHEADFLDDVEIPSRISSQEIRMAEQLVNGMTSKWNPDKYKDTYYADLMKLIKYKIKHGETESYTQEAEDVEPTRNVVDLMPLLKESLAKTHQRKSKKSPVGAARAAASKSRKSAHLKSVH